MPRGKPNSSETEPKRWIKEQGKISEEKVRIAQALHLVIKKPYGFLLMLICSDLLCILVVSLLIVWGQDILLVEAIDQEAKKFCKMIF